ncbi:RING finger protein 17-like [Magallana gigas]|uniref:RING finger protein 17-like n=1 Tax=Magallana gigas TaxID=29159 RepID=UPI0033400553
MQIIYCYLHGVAPLVDAETWSKEFKERFAEIVTDQELIAITRDISPDGTHIVDLFLTSDPSTSINDKLVAEGILRKLTDEEQDVVTSDDEPEELELPTDTNQWNIYVSFINSSTNSVMIRLVGEKYSDKLEELEKKFSEEDVEIAEGQVCVAYVDELYHRVRVIKKEPLKAAVYMVDFGEFIVMSIEDIRLLPYCFAQLPQLAFKGKLFSIKPTKESKVWSEAAKYKFLQMAHNKSLVALSCGTEDVMGQEVTLMRLVDTSQQDQDICLDDELLEMGVAEKIRPLS